MVTGDITYLQQDTVRELAEEDYFAATVDYLSKVEDDRISTGNLRNDLRDELEITEDVEKKLGRVLRVLRDEYGFRGEVNDGYQWKVNSIDTDWTQILQEYAEARREGKFQETLNLIEE